MQIEGPGESKKNDIQELIEKEIEDSLFHLGEWAKFTETIEQKYPWKRRLSLRIPIHGD